jgi:class 3 adenylate cyclase/pimeloyl-ACP methyl ester carboxylesterase
VPCRQAEAHLRPIAHNLPMEPQIRYAQTADGVAIAYAVVGQGPPLLFARALFSPGVDDELAWPGALWPSLADAHSVVLWDLRGEGLSGSAPDAGFDDWLADMAAVADAAGGDHFDLVGVLKQSHVAMAYAARWPDRLDHLVVHSPSAPGLSLRSLIPDWLFVLASEHWDDFVDIYALRLLGWERAAVAHRWADRMRAQYTSAQFLRQVDVMASLDATGETASIKAPTLVVDDRDASIFSSNTALLAPFARQLAAAIPGAQLAIIKPGDVPAAEIVERFLSGSSGARETRPGAAPVSGTAVILFTDIVSSTALTERMGDAVFRDASRALDAGLRAVIRDAGGAAIDGKLLGDGVLATFPSAAQAIDGARRCLALSAASELGLHIGLHAGDVIREDDNVYGGAVNIASRICGLSVPGEILVSDVVRGMARSSAGVEFEDRGEQEMKGVGEPVRVYAVRGGE